MNDIEQANEERFKLETSNRIKILEEAVLKINTKAHDNFLLIEHLINTLSEIHKK